MEIICQTDEELDAELELEDEVMNQVFQDWSDEDLQTPMNVSIFCFFKLTS